MVRIFLAHASEDKDAVIDLYNRLKAKGFKPWLDKVDLLPGQSWRAEIPKAIRDSDVFIACLSKASIAKQGYIQREFRMALQKMGDMPPGQIYLIPVCLDDCQVPELRQEEYGINLADFQGVDLFREGEFERLVKSIELHFPNSKFTQTSSASVANTITTESWLTLDDEIIDWLEKKSQASTNEAAIQKVFDWLKATKSSFQRANTLILMGYRLGQNSVDDWLNDFKARHHEKSVSLNKALQCFEAGEFNEYIYDGTPKQYLEDHYMSDIIWINQETYIKATEIFWHIELPSTSQGFGVADTVLQTLTEIFKVDQDKLKYEGSKAWYEEFRKWFNPTYFGADVWNKYSTFIKTKHQAQFYDERNDALTDFVAQAIGWSYIYGSSYLRLSGTEARQYYNVLTLGKSLRTLQQSVKHSPPEEQYVSELDTAKGLLRWAEDSAYTPEIYFFKPLSPYSSKVRIRP
ncbi:toll/interleukin-1 receptor domain-containing protein [Leptothoe kymatousa]|uniref:Toll/interleukin-1 receptor domain-containing protein n=1 Tax=Leptothoe kymatousa TAU-MAC 1615 TaxID=2364775 RepID=A0ABS5Y409_9CYAN|nr:toll/interleukin-1 receptor domain-containing protein [Leptothoe kymatousa]MBT9312551.1 toll/interleukin-1 receptor domain-containing protein [Leptothoe kymatousa TAU-MAC 1615]